MSCPTMQRHGGTINACERSQSEKAADYTIPAIWHSGKSKTMGTVKDQWLSSGWRWEERDEYAEPRGF